MSNKKKFVRNGVEREFSEHNIKKFSKKGKSWPESEGWVPKPEELSKAGGVEDKLKLKEAAKAEKTAAASKAKEEAEKAAPVATIPQNGTTAEEEVAASEKTSLDFKTNADDVAEIKTILAGATAEAINNFFDGETRQTLNNLKEELLKTVAQ